MLINFDEEASEAFDNTVETLKDYVAQIKLTDGSEWVVRIRSAHHFEPCDLEGYPTEDPDIKIDTKDGPWVEKVHIF